MVASTAGTLALLGALSPYPPPGLVVVVKREWLKAEV